MARTVVSSDQIKDTTINKDDIDVSTTGKALPTRIIAGTNITLGSTGVDSGTGDVTINASGGGMTWTEVTGTSQSASVNNGYITNNASQVVITIPTTAPVGSIIRVVGKGAGGWRISQNASESIKFGDKTTTTGTGGYLASTNANDAIELECTVADTTWTVISCQGNISIDGGATYNAIDLEITKSGSNTYTFPSATDTLVGRASTDTLTNKVITDSSNTVYDSRERQSIVTGSDYSNATTTGTEVTALQFGTTGTGTFMFEFYLLVQSSATGTGWKLAVNHTGTATLYSVNMLYPSTGASGATGVGEDITIINTGTLYEASANTAFATTAPNLGPTAGVAAINTNILVRVNGIFNATVSGDFELWAAAETTGTIKIMINSVGRLIKFS